MQLWDQHRLKRISVEDPENQCLKHNTVIYKHLIKITVDQEIKARLNLQTNKMVTVW